MEYQFLWSCPCISLDINKIFSRNWGPTFRSVAVHQGCSILFLIPRQLTLSPLVNSARSERHHGGSNSAHANATFMAGIVGTNCSYSSESRGAVTNASVLQELGEHCVISVMSK